MTAKEKMARLSKRTYLFHNFMFIIETYVSGAGDMLCDK